MPKLQHQAVIAWQGGLCCAQGKCSWQLCIMNINIFQAGRLALRFEEQAAQCVVAVLPQDPFPFLTRLSKEHLLYPCILDQLTSPQQWVFQFIGSQPVPSSVPQVLCVVAELSWCLSWLLHVTCAETQEHCRRFQLQSSRRQDSWSSLSKRLELCNTDDRASPDTAVTLAVPLVCTQKRCKSSLIRCSHLLQADLSLENNLLVLAHVCTSTWDGQNVISTYSVKVNTFHWEVDLSVDLCTTETKESWQAIF